MKLYDIFESFEEPDQSLYPNIHQRQKEAIEHTLKRYRSKFDPFIENGLISKIRRKGHYIVAGDFVNKVGNRIYRGKYLWVLSPQLADRQQEIERDIRKYYEYLSLLARF